MAIVAISRHGNLVLAHDSERAFPGLLIQGDTIAALLEDLEDELPTGYATRVARRWLETYEAAMATAGLRLPYVRSQQPSGLEQVHAAVVSADEVVRGLTVTGVCFVHDFIEVHMGDVILTGYTEPFGMIGCQGAGPATITNLIGKTIDQLSVVEGEYVAIDSGENRLAFPIGGPSATGPESVRLFRRGHDELAIHSAHWIW